MRLTLSAKEYGESIKWQKERSLLTEAFEWIFQGAKLFYGPVL